MSGTEKGTKPVLRRLFVRLGLVLVYVFLVGLVFVLGKQHSLLVDNKSVAGTEAIDGLMVSIDGKEGMELYKGDRDMAKLKGQRHRVSVETLTGEKKIEKTFVLPLDADMLLLSVPKLVEGTEPFIEIFVPKDQPAPANEQVGDNNAFTSPGGDAAPAAPAAPVAP
jgi:hypothetical protein